MKEIPLTRGMVALVDDEDYERLAQFQWYYAKSLRKRTGYAMRRETLPKRKSRIIQMHRIILNTPSGYVTDHINDNGLDNRKENLRVATHSQNKYNTGKRLDNTSGFKGVCWCKDRRRWQAKIHANRKDIHLGRFKNKLEAARAYNEAAIKLHGEFARLNLI